MLSLNLDVMPGANIFKVIENAIDISNQLKVRVSFVFNYCDEYAVYPNDTVDRVIKRMERLRKDYAETEQIGKKFYDSELKGVITAGGLNYET